ncbi:hypothetical protein GCM10023183_14190 [Nibribacter koreensis]|uniref:Por secretion system C-terminal sorting domain-containing protein n=2 Tax=Nibribacter koreensis TaxID=1084519 RepID=A0ABP8FFA0_9BACT
MPNGAGLTSALPTFICPTNKYRFSIENGSNLTPINQAKGSSVYAAKFDGPNSVGYCQNRSGNSTTNEDLFMYELSAYEFSLMDKLWVQAKASNFSGAVIFDFSACAAAAREAMQNANCNSSQPSVMSGPSDPCPGQIVTYCIEANPEYTNYEWDVPRAFDGVSPVGWVIISGQGTNCVKVRVGERPGTMKVKVTHSTCGTKVRTKPVSMGKNCPIGCVTPSGTITGPSTLCYIYEDTENPYLFSVQNPQAGVTYDFVFPNEGFIVTPISNGMVEVLTALDPNEVGEQQTITLISSNDCGSTVSTFVVNLADENCEPANPLPVELVTFTAASGKGAIHLNWSTATEINNDRFDVERSLDGKTFIKIGQVKGAGNSSLLLHYTFTDRETPAGTIYYRLNQVDFDNTQEYSKVIAVRSAKVESTQRMTIHPNPVMDGAMVVQYAHADGQGGAITLRLRDIHGKTVHSRELKDSSGEVRLEVNTLGLRKGMYILSLTVGQTTQVQRVVIQ